MKFADVRKYVTGLLSASFVNKSILDNLAEDENKNLTYKGAAIKGGASTATEISYDDTTTAIGANNVQSAIEYLKDYPNVFISEYIETIEGVNIKVEVENVILSKTEISNSSSYITHSVTFLDNLSNYDSVDFKVYYYDNYILTNYKPTDIIGKNISAPGPESKSIKMNVTDTGASDLDCWYNMSLEIIGHRKE